MMSDLYSAATGLDLTPQHLLQSGERIFNVLKALNVKMGARRQDDLPSRGFTWSQDKPLVMNGESYGSLREILDQYYEERGWNVESGVPTRDKLVTLDLEDVSDDIGV